jgi:hypothetical protein
MGLDACVYCDCFERGRLIEPPPHGIKLQIENSGRLERVGEESSLEEYFDWVAWQEQRACVHSGGFLVRHRLGNIALIGILRKELGREKDRFPILTSKVVYSGSHAGDFLCIELIPVLQQELEILNGFKCADKDARRYLLGNRSPFDRQGYRRVRDAADALLSS